MSPMQETVSSNEIATVLHWKNCYLVCWTKLSFHINYVFSNDNYYAQQPKLVGAKQACKQLQSKSRKQIGEAPYKQPRSKSNKHHSSAQAVLCRLRSSLQAASQRRESSATQLQDLSKQVQDASTQPRSSPKQCARQTHRSCKATSRQLRSSRQ